MKLKNTTWNTYRITGYTYDVANDQRSAGGVHLHQVRKTRSGWQKRILQSNGRFSASSEVKEVSNQEGQTAFETAKSQA
jgi:hypothetical protein